MKFLQSSLLVSAIAVVICFSSAYGATPSDYPPLDTVIQRVMQTSAVENSEYHAFNQHYTYTRQKVTEFYDGSGNLKERQTRLSTNTPSPQVVIAAPQPSAPQPALRPVAYHKDAGADGPSVHGVSLGKKEDLLNPDLIKRYTITITGREMINGRPALIVDFKPASDSLPILNIKDRFLNCVAGRAWVDEGDYVLEKVEVHLNQKVSVLGGLVGTVSKFTLSFDRSRTPDGYWFTHDLDWHVEAREATYQRVVNHHEEIDDVQKTAQAR
jgi:hypothetical protein